MNDSVFPLPPPKERIYCNRTLNMRTIRAIGFDMDYTLIHYHPEPWERRAYEHAKRRLASAGWPVGHLEFDPEFATLGLIMDLELGNVVKANRFGYVKRAYHGTQEVDFTEMREIYAREPIDLADSRYRFMNTLFALSEAHLYAQVVDMLDAGELEKANDELRGQPLGYSEAYRLVRGAIDEAHMMGELKAEIIAEPDQFVALDPDIPLALMDLKHAGKKVMLITNSGWPYTRAMMEWSFDRFMPKSKGWRDLFDIVIVAARKPAFFSGENPVFDVVDEDRGLLQPVLGNLEDGRVYHGGSAAQVERHLGVRGEDVLYVGDHIFSDVNVSKRMHRWRTALVVRELEQDLEALEAFKPRQAELTAMMDRKERMEHRLSQMRLDLQRLEFGYGPQPEERAEALERAARDLRKDLRSLDAEIAPLAEEYSRLSNERWGLLMRAGNDKSHLARQIEKNADIYMSRVGNFLGNTPFVYLRSPRGSLPHDHGPAGGS
ncbi:MAG: HAD family hydrolase [Sandaracinus sp.]|nr:HAD family hydrolase [Sandaracinus sp.]|tara:strand:+ start:328 stop:1800 length:1473 start_codon:yes stop_codon:yes gene_type:complete